MPQNSLHFRRRRAKLRTKPNRFESIAELNPMLEVKSLSVEQYIQQLCRLIAREGENPVLRREYENLLWQLRAGQLEAKF